MRLLSPTTPDQALMWITPDRVFYHGLLGAPSVRSMGAVMVYVAVSGQIRIQMDGGDWQTTELAVVPPYVPHQEINASPTETLECVLCRSDGQAVAINLDIEPAEKPEQVLWVDPTHPHGGV